jgi:thymidylate synthase
LTDYPVGENGPIYGKQWRSWKCSDGKKIDQIANLIKNLVDDPYSRRHIISAWNVGELDDMSLPPCHILYQFYVSESNNIKRLSCHMFQRSCDMFLGCPFNIASMALLTLLIATQVSMVPYEIIHSISDAHIYKNHIGQVKKQLLRKPMRFPKIKVINKKKDICEYNIDDIVLTDYVCHSGLKAEMAV